MAFLTYRYRVKGKAAARELARMAGAVNFVWNFCGETQEHSRRWGRRWLSAFSLEGLTAGSSRALGLHADTIGLVCQRFVAARNSARHRPRWRSASRSLGWVPFKGRAVRLEGDAIVLLGQRYRVWLSRPASGTIRHGSFAQDARGRWFLNLQCEVEDGAERREGPAVGIDLGLESLAALSTGEKIVAPQHFRRHEEAIARAQRAGRKKRVRAIHARITNVRRHHLHEITTRLARDNRLIVVGNVSPSKLARTRLAKSVLDAGWTTLRTQLRYKAIRHGATFIEVDEAGTSRTCSSCGAIPDSSPKGMGALGVRRWDCQECGASHDRDVNAARNILASGLSAALQETGATLEALTSRDVCYGFPQ